MNRSARSLVFVQKCRDVPFPNDSDATTDKASERPTALEARLYRLVVVQSPDERRRGEVCVLRRFPFYLGRSQDLEGDAGAALTDPKVSRRHAVLEQSGNQLLIRDLGSSNGTRVNGKAQTQVSLADGDVVRVGSHCFVLQVLDEAACRLLVHRRRPFSKPVGHSPRMLAVLHDVERLATSNQPALILGETGVGKEVLARALHDASQRKGPFIPVNCGSLPSNLIESEFFGHEAGAFTGASSARGGLFDEADQGTILLDEIGDMPAPLQVNLLRVLADGEIRPVGGRRPHKVDARVVAATHIDLASAVAEGKFRGDLYARLRGAVIRVPPLRQRREDILLLASHFLVRAGSKLEVSPDAAEILLTYAWPFNVRELEQVCVHIASVAADAEKIDLQHLPEFLRPQADAAALEMNEPIALPQVMEGVLLGEGKSVLDVSTVRKPTADTLEQVLRFYKGNIAHVSAYFSKDRHQIYRWCRQYGIDPAAIRDELKLGEGEDAGDGHREQ